MDVTLAPQRYIQEKDIISRVGEFIKNFGENPLFVADPVVFKLIKNRLEEGLGKAKLPLSVRKRLKKLKAP